MLILLILWFRLISNSANRLQIKRYDSLDVIDRLAAIKISPRMLLEKKERGNVEKSIVELQDKTHCKWKPSFV